MSESTHRVLNNNKLKLGFFSTNCSGGLSPTKIPGRWKNTWENNLRLAKLADDAGIEFLLPIARWVGYGGETDFHGNVLETMTWASGMLAHTKSITVFATVHTAFFHPIVAAKQLATIDQMSGGRLGLNVVCGWNKPEYDAFGMDLPENHLDRYELGQEWFDAIKALWAHPRERFDWHGKHYTMKGAHSDPAPVNGELPYMNAAGSAEGREFAIKNVDFLFMFAQEYLESVDEVAAIKAQGEAMDRDVGVFTFGHVICRPTKKEAEEFLEYYVEEHADWEAVDNLMGLMGMHAQSFPAEAMKVLRRRFAMGHGGYPLIGDPDTIANKMAEIPEAGFSGTTLSFVDYAEEFPYFRDEVLPRLEAKGLREPFKGHD